MIGGVELMEMEGAAMSELYKAMQRIEDYQSTKPLYKQLAEIKGIASTARYGYDIQHQLTIPKSIAEIADKYVDEFGFNLIEKDEALELTVAIDNPADELESEMIYDFADNNPELLAAYLAGKALGVDLVKVVEG